ncbi:MAG: C45 family autoproteolytic acyltransferase/hydrolase [Clostridiales bacterium]|nr:C45 family autoproteolytic acyltransferase/hydrolase [Clostridiales bacterium]
MYHDRFRKSHYEAGYNYGNLLYKKGMKIGKNLTFGITEERKLFADKCLPIYEKYYPEILDEIRGLADGQKDSYEDFYTFLLSMYCFTYNNHCTCFAFKDKDISFFGRNSDFLVALEKLYDNCLYKLNGVYSFNGNTTAFIEMEDGINEHGLAVGLTFIYPKMIGAGFNSGMLVRYLLEKCKTVNEAIKSLNTLPIASQQTLTVMDSFGDCAVIECNCAHIEAIKPTEHDNFIVATNSFVSPKMIKYNHHNPDNWHSDERYSVACNALRENKNHFSFELAKDILSGKYGFMCQYERSKGTDTVWSVIYDTRNKKIFRVEGNPARKKYLEDTRMKFV